MDRKPRNITHLMKQQKIRGDDYFFEDINSANEKVILLVHGHPFDHSMWRYQIDSLSRFRLILPDLRGYGKTYNRFDKIFIEDHALDAALLLDSLNIGNVHLIGLSMGGQVIVEFARLFPHRVNSMVICDSNPSGETESSYSDRLELAIRMLSIGMNEYTQQDIHKYLHPDAIIGKGEVYNHLYQMMTSTLVESAVASHRGRAERRDNYSSLRHIQAPTLVVAGEKDCFTTVDEMEAIAHQIPNSDFAVVQNAGHMPNIEQPEAFNKLLTEFYKIAMEHRPTVKPSIFSS